MLPALGLPLICCSQAQANDTSSQFLSLSAADSLFYYQLILERVRGDAYQNIAIRTTVELKNCNELLNSLRSSLQKLRKKLEVSPNISAWPMVERHFNSVENNLFLVQTGASGQIDAAQIHTLTTTTAALEVLLATVAKTCDPDPDGTIKTLINKVLDAIDQQNQAVQSFAESQKEWSRKSQEIEKLFNDCKHNLELASLALALSTQGHSTAKIDDAKNFIRMARQDLDTLGFFLQSAGQESAKSTLEILLRAIVGSLQVEEVIRPTAYLFSEGAGLTNVPSAALDRSNATLINRVRSVVTNPNKYFSPGSGLQVINCIAVCWPIWTFYLADDDTSTRTDLIQSALNLGLFWGAERSWFTKIAADLQGAYSDTFHRQS